ncbi:MAG: glycosyltransferase family 39 protein, partial [Cyanobacteria bacterium J06641_5]
MDSRENYRDSTFRHDALILVFLLVLSILIRFPHFFRDVINWDESTFILLGQSVLDGHLPYTRIWDVKPPLAFLSYASFIFVFGKNIIGIRFAGSLCVTVASLFCYLTASNFWNRRIGILAGTLSTIFISSLPDGQATMTETVALVPLMAALYYICANSKFDLKRIFLAGLLLAVAAAIRLNLAYVSLTIGIFLVLFSLRKNTSWHTAFRVGLAYVFG